MSDLISREAVLERAETSTFTDKNEKRKFIDWLNYCLEQPTVEAVQVVHGEWIKNKQNPEAMRAFHEMGIGKGMGLNSIYWTCSECGSWGTPTSNFCNNCGADMRKKV